MKWRHLIGSLYNLATFQDGSLYSLKAAAFEAPNLIFIYFGLIEL